MRNPVRRSRKIGKTQGGRVKAGTASEKWSRVFTRGTWQKLSRECEGLKLIREVDNPHVRLLYDIYHEQAQTGDGMALIKEAVPYTEVFHVADHPGRRDPGTGEMDYDAIYNEIRETGYERYIAMEFRPVGEPVSALRQAVDQMRAGISKVSA